MATSRRTAPFALALMTDPRLPDIHTVIRNLPVHPEVRTAVIFRHYEAEDRKKLAQDLCNLSQERDLLFLVAGDAELARSISADGIHLPEWQLTNARRLRHDWPEGLVSAACHSKDAVYKAEASVDCAFLSPVFKTVSHGNVNILGTEQFSEICSLTEIPILALGGISEENADELLNTNAAGIGAISVFG
ncbi:MAG: thiamine phosphate synthase [Aquisalinus sp.]|nr:thiamine phosphate synthase [Aquisalinus sp.]